MKLGHYTAASMYNYGAAWAAGGYSGAGNVMGLLGSLKGRAAIVAGNAEGVFQEVEAVRAVIPDAVLFAANDVGMYLRDLDHWCSLHSDRLARWRDVRWLQSRGESEHAVIHSILNSESVNFVWEGLNPCFALSGYFAMQIAWLMGCAPIILCGCPGDHTRRFFEGGPRKDFDYGNVREQVISEMNRLPEFKDVVRSMSGWTREYFGGL